MDESPEHAPGRSVSAEISTRLVKLLREYTGRGPTKARTYVHDELVVCMLQDTMTKGDRVLAEHGQEQPVLDHRQAFQDVLRSEAQKVIEEVTGRRVVAFLSDSHVDPDVGIEAFVLEPPEDPDEAQEPKPVQVEQLRRGVRADRGHTGQPE